MLIVVDEKCEAGRVEDPVIELHLEQFEAVTRRVAELLPMAYVSQAKWLAERLCEGSRQIVYRMHRVTRSQVRQSAELFEKAASLIEDWELSQIPDRELIEAYARHIRHRAELLRSYLNGHRPG